jgi:hypothetical protein
MKNYKIDFDSVKKRLHKIQENIQLRKSHDELLGGLDDTSNNNLQRQKLIENEDLAWKQHNSLENAKRKTLEMENVSIEVMRQLDINNNSLRGINSRVVDLNTELDGSKSIMGRIMKKENRNKVVIIGFSFILLVVLLIILYLKFK